MTNPLKQIREYLKDYSHFADETILAPLSLWIAATYMFEAFDSFPYMVITAKTKRSGKTRLSELVGNCANMPFHVAGATAPALFRKIQDDKPTIIWDEAETLSSESNSLVRSFLNVGYRKGQTIPRVLANGVKDWPTYCPKVFVLIGDAYDTLRDRSIIVTMERGEPRKRFLYETAKTEGLEIVDSLRKLIADNLEKITDAYANESLPFLTDREEEIWRPLFALAKILDKEQYEKMRRTAVDMSADKTNETRYKPNEEQEKIAENQEYGLRLLEDLYKLSKGKKAIPSSTLIKELHSLDLSPWRKFRGTGLTDPRQVSDLLIPFNLKPTTLRMPGDWKTVLKGYLRKDIEKSYSQYVKK